MLLKNIEEYKMRIEFIKKNPLKFVNLYDIYLLFRFTLGDMYELISDIELFLHKIIINSLRNEYGSGEKGWWRKGVPTKIRSQCAMAYEEDDEPADEPFCYANFIHLQKIIDKNWMLFSTILPKQVIINKNAFLKKFIRLNKIRNKVMHPIKSLPLTEDDFEFVKEFHRSIAREKWQIKF
jgi:hypothetical protein